MNTGTESESDRPAARFRPSCLQCQRLKKKCDRKRPQCSLCTRQNRTCSYDERSTYSDTVPSDSAPISDSRIEFSTKFRNDFPSVYFLDSVLFQRSGTQIQDAGSDLVATLSSLVGDISTNREFVSLYFEFIHPWLPFVSKMRFSEKVLNPLRAKQIGNMLLISSMKLVAENIVDGNTLYPLYNSVKLSLLRLEMAGNLDFRTLQAWIMISLYELGHGIYPAAYFTIGSCARYARALGVHLSVENPVQSPIHDELDREERRRS
uniref:Zn(2)-C6 fungal-type domain-containing protein n=1 Tax=Bionectria ochroleuca TaxID=29856 RepID=A0A0B7K9B7_BIOOC